MATLNKSITAVSPAVWIDSGMPAATADGVRTVSGTNSGAFEVIASAATPATNFRGHPIMGGTSIALRVVTGDKIWLLPLAGDSLVSIS